MKYCAVGMPGDSTPSNSTQRRWRIACLAGLSFIGHLAPLEAQAGTLYWSGLDALNRVNTDGTGSTSVTAPPTVRLPTDIELDRVTDRLYWTETFGTYANSIRSIGIDGSNPTTVLNTGSGSGLALLPEAGKMVWAERETHSSIRMAGLDGSSPITLLTDVHDPRGLEVDPISKKIYWVEFGGKLRRADLDGSNVVDIVVSGMTRPFDVDIDPLRGKLYWSELGSASNNQGTGAIFQCDLDGKNVSAIVTGLSQPSGIDVDPLGGRIYFVNGLAGKIMQSGLMGENPETLLSGVGIPQYLVVDTPQVPEVSFIGYIVFGALLRRRTRR